ncbi:helix-turn-helix domain-containing protein [Streptomyces aureus]|uniref:helix-turn-helix domain-containing protein n=1 Tax=Streptomyces aureus TaxID=193461 RepID=UPI0006E4479D|nr:helix-turn-helix transcriptional regulator [Streptomyces aureus]
MTEVARTQGSSSEIERGGVAEVAALGNVLTGLFKRLGITQTQYAHRVHLDKSAVSRYLSGRRLAPQEFVDRLVREVEDHLGAPLQLEAKEALRNQRLEALRVCNPDEFQLESLRGELARSRRDTRRAERNIEALQTLLERKEDEVRRLADDLTQLRLDWGAERADPAPAYDLLREVARLRQDLQDAERLRAEAEHHGAELRDRVLRLEEELSRRSPATGAVPLDAFQAQLAGLWEEENFPEASRELTEAAWSRPLGELVRLLGWLKEEVGVGTAATFAADVARLRPLEDVLEFAPEVARQGRSRIRDSWTSAVAARITPRNAAAVHQGLRNTTTPSGPEGDRVLAEAVSRIRSDADVVSIVSAALSGTAAPLRMSRLARTLARGRPTDRFGLRLAVGLAAAGRHDMAALVLGAGLRDGGPPEGDDLRLGIAVRDLGDSDIELLFDLVTWLDDTRLMTAFAQWLDHPHDVALRDRLFTTMAQQGRLGLLDASLSRSLETSLRLWRRSRGQ